MSAGLPPPTAVHAPDSEAGSGFTLDEVALERRRLESARRLHTQQIPALRLLGFVILSSIVAIQSTLAGPPLPLVPLIAMNLAYAVVAWFVLSVGYGRVGEVNLPLLLFHTDVLVWLVLLHWLEPRNTFFAYLLLVRVVDQVGFGFRRALYFAHAVPLAYLVYALAEQAGEGNGASDLGGRVAIAVVLYLLGLYLSATGLVIERLRGRTRQAVRAARSLVDGLNRQAHDLQKQAVELEAARRDAEAANHAKSQFLAVTSHEFRTPMNGILGAAELLMETPLSVQQKRYVKTAHRSASALLALIDDVLDLSRIESGQLELHPTAVDVGALIDDAVELVRVAAHGRPIVLQVELPPRLPGRLVVDPLRLRQLLLNLLHNAIKFTDRGQVRLAVQVLSESADAMRLRFSVHDTGIGIAPERLRDIFDRFIQVDSSSTRRHGGSGLGLAIVRDLAKRMGGGVGVESRPGHGSHFWIDLPLGRPTEPASADVDGAPGAHATDGDDVPVQVLLIEDDPINRMVVEDMLRVLGCDVALAEDGAAGLAAVARGGHDLVFMDCHMPVMDGYEATRRIREAEAQHGSGGRVPIVALTADTLAEDRARCLSVGMDDFLSKPVSRSQLAATIRRWTGRRTNPTTQW
jgi:signal transduction histidine kinase/ActR/RegA family two-component response regulator